MAIHEIYDQLAQKTLSGGGTKDHIYTPASDEMSIIKTILLVNYGESATWVKIWHGGTADGNLIYPATYTYPTPRTALTETLASGPTYGVYAEAGAASSIVLSMYGNIIS